MGSGLGLGLGFTLGREGGATGAPAAPPPLLSYPAGGPGSAEFTDGIDAGWAVAGPAIGGAITVEDGRLKVAFNTSHSADSGSGNNAAGTLTPRLERAAPAGDFDLYAMFSGDPKLPTVPPAYTGIGFVLLTASSSARLEVYAQAASRNNTLYIKYATTLYNPVGGVVGPFGNNYGFPTHYHLNRTGNVFTFKVSYNGTEWTQAHQWTWAVTLTKVAAHFMQLTPNGHGMTWYLDHLHMDLPAWPVLAAEAALVRTPVLDETFANLAAWSNDSAGVGGAATVSGGVLTLACGTADQSTGRLLSNLTFGENQGIVLRARRIAGTSQNFLGIGLRATGPWVGQYAANRSLVYEGNLGSGIVRTMRNAGLFPTATDWSTWTFYLSTASLAHADLSTGWKWIRFEAVGPFLRTKVWPDGSPEPADWLHQSINSTVRGTGKVGIALSHNDGSPVAGTAEIAGLQVYEVTT